jgi:hypothetical protein
MAGFVEMLLVPSPEEQERERIRSAWAKSTAEMDEILLKAANGIAHSPNENERFLHHHYMQTMLVPAMNAGSEASREFMAALAKEYHRVRAIVFPVT